MDQLGHSAPFGTRRQLELHRLAFLHEYENHSEAVDAVANIVVVAKKECLALSSRAQLSTETGRFITIRCIMLEKLLFANKLDPQLQKNYETKELMHNE